MSQAIEVLSSIINLTTIAYAIVITIFGLGVGALTVKMIEVQVFRKGVRRCNYQYTAGGRGHYFYNADLMHSTPNGINLASNWFTDKITELKKAKQVDKLAFIEEARGPVGLLAHKDLLVSRTNIPAIIVRIKRRLDIAAVTGRDSIREGDKIVVIADTATSGRKIVKAVNRLQKQGLGIKIPYALAEVDLNQGAAARLKELGTELLSYRTLKQKKVVGAE